jgi:hypothetical protein
LALLRQRGCIADVVERRLANTFTTKDLFGFLDVLAMEPGQPGILGVQTTTVANQATRIKKILDEPRALAWLGCGCRITVHGWALKGARGRRKLWALTETPITERDWLVPQ